MRLIGRTLILFLMLGAVTTGVLADAPELSSWLLNTTGLTGYNSLPANVQQIRYSVGSVYVNASGIPYYAIGPWQGNPNVATNQNWLYQIPRTPTVAGTKTATPLGAIGAWTTGVAVFNPRDANSFNNQNIWHQNAVVVEASGFDSCLGHPQMTGAYHHHQNPRCLYVSDSRRHSPILGFAFDGYPIYGPYGYANADGTGGIKRIVSSYRARSITTRDSPCCGPVVGGQYPLGYYVEDFEYVSRLGDLDPYNGRFAVTPEYPTGTYAYYTTVDDAGNSAYPYAVGPSYNGIPLLPNGHVTIGETVSVYAPSGPGRVPESIMVSRVSSTEIALTWNVSCTPAGASDYGIYEGQLGSWYSHARRTCRDTGQKLQQTVPTSTGNTYYLVVPLDSSHEGSYGAASSGAEIPPGAILCAPTQTPASCP